MIQNPEKLKQKKKVTFDLNLTSNDNISDETNKLPLEDITEQNETLSIKE